MRGKRVVVVGASSGIGRAFAARAVKAGADVVLGARRGDALEQVVADAGGGTPVVVDIADAPSRERFVAAAAERLGQVDLVLSAAGTADLHHLAGTDAAAWQRMLATNVVGVDRTVALVLSHLAPGGIVAVLSSEAAARPAPGLVAYAASKAALDTALDGWRIEHPGVRFSRIVLGATFPTGFADRFDVDRLVPILDEWRRQGLMQDEVMAPDDVAGCLLDLYAAALRYPGVGIETVVLRSPSGVADASG